MNTGLGYESLAVLPKRYWPFGYANPELRLQTHSTNNKDNSTLWNKPCPVFESQLSNTAI